MFVIAIAIAFLAAAMLVMLAQDILDAPAKPIPDPWEALKPDTGFPHYDNPADYYKRVDAWREKHYPEGNNESL